MPFSITTFQLPCGANAAREELAGVVTGAEAAELVQHHSPGGSPHELPTLVSSLKMKSLDRDGSSAFSNRHVTEWTALVMTNPVLRMSASFIIRVTGSPRMRVFADDQEAIRWLDERVRDEAVPA